MPNRSTPRLRLDGVPCPEDEGPDETDAYLDLVDWDDEIPWEDSGRSELDQDDESGLLATAHALVVHAIDEVAGRLGRAAQARLENDLVDAVGWAVEHYDPGRGDFAPFARSLIRKALTRFVQELTPSGLAAELRDEQLRDAAGGDPDGMDRYLRDLSWRLLRLRRQYPRRWSTPGHTTREFVDHVVVETLAALRGRGLGAYEKPGREASLVFADAQRTALRRRRVIYEVEPVATEEPALNAEEQLLAKEAREIAREIVAVTKRRLTKPQRQWLAAIERHLEDQGRLVPAQVGASLGKNRSSATRAIETLQGVMRREGAEELVTVRRRRLDS